METEPTPLVGGAAYDAPSSALLICFGLLQFIWVMAFFASVPILLAASHASAAAAVMVARVDPRRRFWVDRLERLCISRGNVHSSRASEAAFRQGYLAHYWMWAPPSLTLPWGWIVGLVYLLVCLTAYPLFLASERGPSSRPFTGPYHRRPRSLRCDVRATLGGYRSISRRPPRIFVHILALSVLCRNLRPHPARIPACTRRGGLS